MNQVTIATLQDSMWIFIWRHHLKQLKSKSRSANKRTLYRVCYLTSNYSPIDQASSERCIDEFLIDSGSQSSSYVSLFYCYSFIGIIVLMLCFTFLSGTYRPGKAWTSGSHHGPARLHHNVSHEVLQASCLVAQAKAGKIANKITEERLMVTSVLQEAKLNWFII